MPARSRHCCRVRSTGLSLIALLAAALFAGAGCGSKISEANYYRVQIGMAEDAVDDLLGPPQREGTEDPPVTRPATAPSPAVAATAPAETRPLGRVVKTWTRGALVITVEFENGKVVARRGQGQFMG